MEMSERIRERRLFMGYTQEELGEKLGLQKSAIAKYENGRVENIKRSIIANMAKILECSPAYLMGWDEEDPTLLKRDAALEDIEKILSINGYTLCCENYDDDYFLIKNSCGQTITSLYNYELLTKYDFLKKKGTITAEMLISNSLVLYPEERDHISKYRDLDHHGKEMVDFTLQKEWERSTAGGKNAGNAISMAVKEHTSYLNAAHIDENSTLEERQADDQIMMDDSEWE